jgi:restriction system protein
MNIIYHYPPELLNLLIDVIPLLNRSKRDVIMFFKGAGVRESILKELSNIVLINKEAINKYEIVRKVLTQLNEHGEQALRERREVLKRVIEFESFESCWDLDRLKAKGLVHEIRQVVNVKDSFTRMKQEKEKVEQQSREIYLSSIEEVKKKARSKELFIDEISKLILMKDHQKRGKLFEDVLNRLFNSFDVLIKEAFTLTGDEKEGITEQIDGVIELDGNIYLVEMKWWGQAVGVDDISKHLVRTFTRSEARGIFISVNGFTAPSITMCKEALSKVFIVLCDLQEIMEMLEGTRNLNQFLKEKIRAAIVEKKPYHRISNN